MSSTEPGFEPLEAGAETTAHEFPAEVRSLLKTISSQIDEADQRHTGLLQDLRERLGQLGQAAENVRDSVPASAAPVYERIEDGLAKLAQQLDAMDEAAVVAEMAAIDPPAALRSAVIPSLSHPQPSQAGAFDPFDVVGDEAGDGPWNAADAEALSRIYEESDAALVRLSPRTEAAPSQAGADTANETGDDVPAFQALPGFGAGLETQSLDRNWLDQRLSDIAQRIEQSLLDFRGDLSLETLGKRFDVFEERMGSMLGDVASRTDTESLRLLESQVQDLASHLEQAEQQLGRLDGIEQQLQAVIDHLSAEAEATPTGVMMTGELPDFKLLANSTADEVAQRFAAQIGANSGDTRIDELGSLLRSLIHDRRHSDEQTYAMLDTVQQAMIRLLDRIDAIEMTQIQSHDRAPVEDHSAFSGETIQDFGAPEPAPAPAPVIGPLTTQRQPVVEVTPAPAASASAAPIIPLTAAPTGVDKVRQDFIADAQRAKARAAAAAEMPAAPAAAPSARVARGLPRATMPATPAPEVAGASVSSRKQRLTALALCLVIAVSGAALFAKSRSPAQPEATPAPIVQTTPADAAPGGQLSAVADEMAAEGEIDVPGASDAQTVVPKATVQTPSLEEGAAFEVPANEPAGVPVPVPDPSADLGDVGPQTNQRALETETLGSDGAQQQGHPNQAPRSESMAPKGIILQDSGRVPSGRELVHLQTQQNAAVLSSRLGSNASQLSPADLMPEEVSKHAVTRIAMTGGEMTEAQPVPAVQPVAAMPGETIDLQVSGEGKTFSRLSLPPATVGPLSLRLAAANGDPSAAFEVGARLAEGKGINQNFHEAIIWYQKSASQGFAQSQYRLGTLYERGLGVKADLARAQMWYQRAAEQGHVKAMHNLAVLNAGRSSGQPDYAVASIWFDKAAGYGLADSQYNLAVLHENGLGVAKDFVRAYKWYSLAGRGGDGEAMRRREAIKAQMTADQRLQAEKEIAIFAPERSIPLVNDPRVAGEDWKKRQDG
jgi:localization factor PodJL